MEASANSLDILNTYDLKTDWLTTTNNELSIVSTNWGKFCVFIRDLISLGGVTKKTNELFQKIFKMTPLTATKPDDLNTWYREHSDASRIEEKTFRTGLFSTITINARPSNNDISRTLKLNTLREYLKTDKGDQNAADRDVINGFLTELKSSDYCFEPSEEKTFQTGLFSIIIETRPRENLIKKALLKDLLSIDLFPENHYNASSRDVLDFLLRIMTLYCNCLERSDDKSLKVKKQDVENIEELRGQATAALIEFNSSKNI